MWRDHEALQKGKRQRRRWLTETKRMLQEKRKNQQCLMFLRNQEGNWKLSVGFSNMESPQWSWQKFSHWVTWCGMRKCIHHLTRYHHFSSIGLTVNGSHRRGKGKDMFCCFLLQSEVFKYMYCLRNRSSWEKVAEYAGRRWVDSGAEFAEKTNGWGRKEARWRSSQERLKSSYPRLLFNQWGRRGLVVWEESMGQINAQQCWKPSVVSWIYD
jgi:hypothetical protein